MSEPRRWRRTPGAGMIGRQSVSPPRPVTRSPTVQANPSPQPTGHPRPGPAVTRRQFLGSTALAGAAALGAPAFVRCRAPNDKLNVAVIGCGGRGGHNLQQVLGENVVALCDVNENALLRAAKLAPQAKQFRDFRKLYDDLKDGELDAVVVSTTEHTHAAATLPALRRKKHVFC